MTSTTSFNKRFQEFKQTYLWSLRKNMAMLILLTVLMFLSLPMILMIALPQWIRNITLRTGVTVMARAQSLSPEYSSFLRSMVPICTVTLVLLFSVILCFTLFGYMQKKRSVDLFHALPVGRVPMLLGRWCAGITILFVPLIINFAAVHFIAKAYGIVTTNLFSSPFTLMLLVMLMGAAVFTFSMFMAVCSGTVFDTMISIIGVNVGYPLLVFLSFYFIDQILPGANLNPGGNLDFMSAFAPFMAAYLPFIRNGFGAGPLTWWLILTVVILSAPFYSIKKGKANRQKTHLHFPSRKISFGLSLPAWAAWVLA